MTDRPLTLLTALLLAAPAPAAEPTVRFRSTDYANNEYRLFSNLVAAAVAADGRTVVMARCPGGKLLSIIRCGLDRHQPEEGESVTGECRQLVLSPDGRTAAVVLADGGVLLWDVASLKVRTQVQLA